jgi:hypothetical protein
MEARKWQNIPSCTIMEIMEARKWQNIPSCTVMGIMEARKWQNIPSCTIMGIMEARKWQNIPSCTIMGIMEARKWQNIPSCTTMEIIRSITAFYVQHFRFYQFKLKVITLKNSASGQVKGIARRKTLKTFVPNTSNSASGQVKGIPAGTSTECLVLLQAVLSQCETYFYTGVFYANIQKRHPFSFHSLSQGLGSHHV